MFTLVKGLTELFIRVYKSCQTGKDKYCRFQLEWHRQCSLLLRDQVDGGVNKELSQIHQRWLGYCEGSGVAKVVHNPVVIAIYSAVFDYLMQRVAKQQTSEQAECDLLLNKQAEDACGSNVQEEDGVYYRFGGATLAAMLHQRYKQLKFVPESKRESVKVQIMVLKAIQCTDKHQLPKYLQYRDNGYMYFPDVHYIPFIKNLDACVLAYANELSFKQYGSKLVEIATEKLRQNNNLEIQFSSLIHESVSDHEREAVHEVYLEMTRKLCNTRIQEFLDAHRQVTAKKDGGTETLSGQNLRDKLLTYHVNPKS